MKILVVDDDRIALRILQQQLLELGHDVVTAANGADAWTAFQDGSFSIVITDWVMSGMDGLELVRKVRSVQDGHYVYVVLLTVKSQTDDVVVAMEAGADDFLSKPFDPHELRVRLAAGERVVDLERKLFEQNRKLEAANRHMKRGLDEAAEIQRSLLPAALPAYEGSQFAWSFRPCDELAGDILNIVPIDQRHVAFYLLDVTGHGVPAALLSVALSRLLTAAIPTAGTRSGGELGVPGGGLEPAELVSSLNDWFVTHLAVNKLFTLFYGVLDTSSQILKYTSAGHDPAFLFRKQGEVLQLNSTGPIVGVMEGCDYIQETLNLESGDRLFVYSDGLTEAVNLELAQFGRERLVAALTDLAENSAASSVEALIGQVVNWSGKAGIRDDISCILLEAARSEASLPLTTS